MSGAIEAEIVAKALMASATGAAGSAAALLTTIARPA
jgi:hypothetical protein